MNAAARLVHQGVITRHLVTIYSLTRFKMAMLFFTMTIVFSALGIVYMSQVNRVLNADYEQSLTLKNHQEMLYAQLLLEKSTLLMQSRIEQAAERSLAMHYPTQRQTVIVHES